jgi:murein DD-endopeptidase MepM/ murein hydrolase activator NlpD
LIDPENSVEASVLGGESPGPMRWSVKICVAVAVLAGVSACSTSPRQPAHVDYRNADRAAHSRPVTRDCRNGYVVRAGDTLSQIAERCGIEMRVLAEANGLRSPYTLRRGQNLSMPRPSVHIVQRGENLYRIGLRYNISFAELADFNRIRAPYELNVGQEIALPGNISSASRNAYAESVPTDTYRAPPAAGAPRFDWPIRGTVISGFGRKPEGGRNDGINIQASAGAEVHAAAGGQVVYAGSELAGYGRLVLLRHSGGFVTAYAHNSRLLVSEGDRVERGQTIARVGSSGTVDSSQVHFEIRRGVNPEDPMRYLRN